MSQTLPPHCTTWYGTNLGPVAGILVGFLLFRICVLETRLSMPPTAKVSSTTKQRRQTPTAPMRFTESRRRSTRSTRLADDERAALASVFVNARGRRRTRKQDEALEGLRRELNDIPLPLLLLSGVVLLFLLWRSPPNADEPSLGETTGLFQRDYLASHDAAAEHKELYDNIYKLATEGTMPPDRTIWPTYARKPYHLKAHYASTVQQCPVTILIMDTKLGLPVKDFGPGQPLWFALESIGAFAPQACVLLQTSACTMENYLGDSGSKKEAEAEVAKVIYENSLPLFRNLIEEGRVRLTFLDYKKYGIGSCESFGDPTPALLNQWFWKDEFIDSVDGDSVLMFQDASSLCYPLEIEQLKEYSSVGGLRPRQSASEPADSACLEMTNRWRSWLYPQRQWQKQQSKPTGDSTVPRPMNILPVDFPAVCEEGRGLMGFGGLTFRSRKWMTKAIQTCPHAKYSGMPVDNEPLPCKVFEDVNEDLYFGTILAAIGAPLPSAYEASLFATAMLWPEQAQELYGLPTSTKQDLRGPIVAGRPYVTVDDQRITIPTGVHKPWMYHSNSLVRSTAMTRACPFLTYTFTPGMSRWEDTRS